MSQGWIEVAWAGWRASLGLACLPQALMLALCGLLLRPVLAPRPRWLLASAAGVLAYAGLAMGDWGQAWPQLDAPAAALSHPLPWLAALAALLALVLAAAAEDSAWRRLLPLALLFAAAMVRPGHDPAALSQLRGGLDAAAANGKIFVFQATQGLALLVAMSLASLLSQRLVGPDRALAGRLQLAGRLLLGIWAVALVIGAQGALSRIWILRWPLWLSGGV